MSEAGVNANHKPNGQHLWRSGSLNRVVRQDPGEFVLQVHLLLGGLGIKGHSLGNSAALLTSKPSADSRNRYPGERDVDRQTDI